MKTITLILSFLCCALIVPLSTKAHQGHSHAHSSLPTWKLSSGSEVKAFFLLHKGDTVYLEKADHSILKIALHDFGKESKALLISKIQGIEKLNTALIMDNSKEKMSFPVNNGLWLLMTCCFFVFSIFCISSGVVRKPVVAILFTGIIALLAFNRNRIYTISGTDPKEIDKAFDPFKPAIHTFWNSDYFYVESRGIPDHEMMTGIVKWQQQVPIPQCYLGANAWPIPLKPEIAAAPVPVNQEHFLRGAVAVAANGVPIFNPYTNTGIDALVDGQLDNFGGHSGRADDYHYHIAPLHLDTVTADVLPIAYALDGFAIYGPLEPDGGPMKALDANHGHFGSDGVYHYHGTKEKPYMIGNMVGKVTEDNTMQIVPQAAAKGVRPALTPLNGAAITDCTPNSTGNGYKLAYQRTNQTYVVDYSWTASGKYTFNFINPTGTTTSVYNGFVPCNVVSKTIQNPVYSESLVISPNPATAECTISGIEDELWQSLLRMSVFDSKGNQVAVQLQNSKQFSVAHLPKGIYFIHFFFADRWMTKKIIIQ